MHVKWLRSSVCTVNAGVTEIWAQTLPQIKNFHSNSHSNGNAPTPAGHQTQMKPKKQNQHQQPNPKRNQSSDAVDPGSLRPKTADIEETGSRSCVKKVEPVPGGCHGA
uniref:Uncharacterized protein n=1 Tax=Eutreptiella gymnastica TaxID=73025 RepID=A0A7S4FV53_9EUGL|mmetsp:Transcript_7102/g.13508  ORF Transcript_7102/g.13508 Transcript_7102/m.13508 type:complete len:108 (+) Transcript_7102:159-482(+)